MELEKAKTLLKEMQENCIKGMMQGAIYSDEKAEQKSIAIETVLQALDNSIPKEKVRKELNDIENMIDKTTRGEVQKYTVGELILFRTIYNKLLEK